MGIPYYRDTQNVVLPCFSDNQQYLVLINYMKNWESLLKYLAIHWFRLRLKIQTHFLFIYVYVRIYIYIYIYLDLYMCMYMQNKYDEADTKLLMWMFLSGK